MKKIKWGVMGTAFICERSTFPGMLQAENCEMYAIAGRSMEKAEQFLGVKLASEKEMVLIVVRQERKNPIMRAIMEHAGMKSKAKSIVFSLPVTDTAGLRLTEELEQES